jgi:CelD/BcsL family acetyltransferase involved in cellulose biosynthesis
MVRLHQQRWTAAGQRGAFVSPRFVHMHRTLARMWAPDGRAVLARLALRDCPLAVIYGFNVGNKFDFYQSGVLMDQSSPLKSPGIVAFLMLMDELARGGTRTFDFLRGSSSYKQRLATDQCPLHRLHALRHGVRSAMHVTWSFTQRAARKSGRWLSTSWSRR